MTSRFFSDSNESESGYWIGALIGGAIGFAAGMLLAPRSGKDMREELKHTVQDVAAGAHDKYDDLKGNVSEKVSSAKSNMQHKAEEAKEDLVQAVHQGKDKAEEIQHQVEDTVDPSSI